MDDQKISIHWRNIEHRLEGLKTWKITEKEKEDIKLFLRDLSLGKVNRGRKIGVARQLKYLDILRAPLVFFKKDTSKLNEKDMENFDIALSKDHIKRVDGKAYSHETKRSIKIMLKNYLRWKFSGNPSKYAELTSWMDTRMPVRRTPEFLSEEEVEKLFKACKTSRERYLVAMLFDTGARAEEFINIRYEDVFPPNGNNFYKINLKEEYSKTCGRTIGVYWKYSNDAIKEYLEERKKQGIQLKEPLFDGTYPGARLFLGRLGKKVLGRRVHFHLFRHSSATYYAPKLNRQELCMRYGWKFSSDMPDVYISRAGIMERQVEEKFTKTDLEELNFKLRRYEEQNKVLLDKVENNEKDNKNIATKLNILLDIFKNNKEIMRMLVRKEKEKFNLLFSSLE